MKKECPTKFSLSPAEQNDKLNFVEHFGKYFAYSKFV